MHFFRFRALTFLLTALILLFFAAADSSTVAAAGAGSYPADLRSIQSSRRGLQDIIGFIDRHPHIFSQPETVGAVSLPDREQRMTVWQTWQAFLDHILFLDSRGRLYSDIYTATAGKEEKARPFFAAFASFLGQYRFALEFIDRMEKNPALHIMLNEPVPELGLTEGNYARLKYRFLNVLRGAEFARLHVLYLYYLTVAENPMQTGMDEDIRTIWEAGRGTGPALTLQNAMRIVGDLGFTAWFPVQKGVSGLMGNVKVHRQEKTLISADQVKELSRFLQPGDILLQRREWYATNIGIPGFWTHAALYIGTPEERLRHFSDPATTEWLKKQGSGGQTLDGVLRATEPVHYRMSTQPGEGGHPPRILEAIGEGVSFTTLEHSAAADSLAVLRPNLPRPAVARALLRAFHYSGRPYDFNFDFRTDSELVCSELIYKAYERTEHNEGLDLPLHEILGRPLISPNEIARLFAEEYEGGEQQFTFVAFLDGIEEEQRAFPSTVDAFRRSWKRPKWYVWMQEEIESDGPERVQ